MWAYLCSRFDGTVNDQTRALTQRRLYAELEASRCKPNADVEGHLNSMNRLRSRLQAVGMTLDDTVFSGMLASSLPSGDRFDRLRGFVETGMDCVDTPEKIIELAITYDRANKADQVLSRTFSSADRSTNQNQPNKPQNGGGGKNKKPQGGKDGKDIKDAKQQFNDDRKAGNCFGCHKSGHKRQDCPEAAKDDDGGQAHISFAGNPEESANNDQSPAKWKQSTASAAGASKKQANKTTSSGGYSAGLWVYDNGANRHLVGDKRYFVEYRSLSAAERKKETVKGYNGVTTPVGVGMIDLCVDVDGSQVSIRLENVFFSPGRPNLFSQSMARKQGFQVHYDDETALYTLSKEGTTSLYSPLKPCGLWLFTAKNQFLSGIESSVEPATMVNYALRDGVADLQCWHERLGHLGHQYVSKMVDDGLVEGMMLRKRQFTTCEACQLAKQRAKSAKQQLDRGVTEKNQLVFADLLFPPANYNCTRYKAVLVLMDAHTRFVTAYPVKSKTGDEINALIRKYVVWAERQSSGRKVKTLFTDGGGEFVNAAITAWYEQHGIVHATTPPNSSRLNMVERTHQTLIGMMKAMMKESGLPTSFWVDALHYAVYLKNRSYSVPVGRTPYEAMWGRRPDLHHVRKFGALAYVHSKVGPSRHKFADNCRVGFLLGFREDTLGCKVYFPTEGTVLYGGQVTVNEQVMYKDRRGPEFESNVREWAHETYPDLTSAGRGDYDLPVAGGREDGGSTRDVVYDEDDDEDEDVVEQVNHAPQPHHAAWVDREPPRFSDDIVFYEPNSHKHEAERQEEAESKENGSPIDDDQADDELEVNDDEDPAVDEEEEDVPEPET